MAESNPYQASRLTAESESVTSSERFFYGGNALFWGFVAAASFALSIYIAINLNARWHDPWMTPRGSQSMTLWWRFGGVMGCVMLLSLPGGITLCFTASTRRKRLFSRLLTVALVLIPLIFGFPF